MFSPLIRKLGHGADYTKIDHEQIALLANVRSVEARKQLIGRGERPENIHLILDGFACRFNKMSNGKRQISALLVPGDFCDLHAGILSKMDHSIATLTPCLVADLPRVTVLDLIEKHPRIGHALSWATLVDEAILRKWLVNMALYEVPQQLAHLLCELLIRLGVAGRGDADGYRLPLTQEDLADVLGVTPVHVNRTLQALRAAGLIVLRKRRLVIPNVKQLKAFCGFDPDYLHLIKRVG